MTGEREPLWPSAALGGGLCTDLYELRMAASYLRRGMAGPATFSLFVRKLPRDRGFLVAAGLEDCLASLEGFHFSESEIAYLREVGLDAEALEALAGLRFTGDVWAVPEGRVVFAGEPLLEVTAPIAEAQLVETVLLNHVTFQTTLASKAARCRLAAGPADLVDFSFRRTQGIEAAMTVARACAVVGFAATSNVEAARRFGLRPSGTMAHSFVEAFEASAFRGFAEDFPDHPVFLVDTYDTLEGVRTAIRVARKLGIADFGVRLDSGDLGALAFAARSVLDEAGFPGAAIVASGGLDEYAIEALGAQRAPIDVYGVGTKMGVSADAPYLDTAYKLVAYGDRPVMKLSPGKVNPPGPKQVFRLTGPEGAGEPAGDLVGARDEVVPPGHEPLLVPVMAGGRRPRQETGDLAAVRRRFEADLSQLPSESRRIRDPVAVQVSLTGRLTHLTETLAAGIRRQLGLDPSLAGDT
ncbi:MAG: nicotinate phosphoribosyltransferase [Carbonactinosporaceae bacterium]